MKRSGPLRRRTPLARRAPLRRSTPTGGPIVPRTAPKPGERLLGAYPATSAPVGRSPIRRTRLAPVSVKRSAALPARRRVVAAVLARDGGCVARRHGWTDACAGPLDVHEVVPRGRMASSWLDPDLCVAICRACHSWVADHPLLAQSAGLLVPRGVYDQNPGQAMAAASALRYTLSCGVPAFAPWLGSADRSATTVQDQRWLLAAPLEDRGP